MINFLRWQIGLWLALMLHSSFAGDSSIAVGKIILQQHERDGAQSDKLLIKACDTSLSLDLNRSVGLNGIASMASGGYLLAGPYVLDAHDGRLVRQSANGYRALTRSMDVRVKDMEVEVADGRRHWHCKLPIPLAAPFSIAPPIAPHAQTPRQEVLAFGIQQDGDSGITAVRPMILGIPGCTVRPSLQPLAFDHAMLIPQAGHRAWWTYSVSEPKLAISADGLDWRYPKLPPGIRSLLSAFIDDSDVIWIATMVNGDDAIRIFKQAMNAEDWAPVPLGPDSLPFTWIDGRLSEASWGLEAH